MIQRSYAPHYLIWGIFTDREMSRALPAWVTVYGLAKPMGLAQVLEALEELVEQLDMDGGLGEAG